jgi:nicotinic acid phosphoribosyltransferase
LEGLLVSEYDHDGGSDIALATDFYQLTMAAAYYHSNNGDLKGMKKNGIFEMFVRKLPSNRSYFVAAGLEQAIYFLNGKTFGSIRNLSNNAGMSFDSMIM